MQPYLFIESVTINGEKNKFLPQKSITIPWRNNDLMITIGSINFTNGNSQGFAYRIVKDSFSAMAAAWQPTSFNISNLSPGTHTYTGKMFFS
jgi:hypothetical protein